MTRLLLTGAGGVVGSALARRFVAAGTTLIQVDRIGGRRAGMVGCDLTDADAVKALVHEWRPDTVLHVAGHKDVFALEKDPMLARRANVETTKNLRDALEGSNCFFVYLSTDYVFEGKAGLHREDSPTEPTTEYGKSKLEGERLLLASGLHVAIARSANIFGCQRDFVSVVLEALRSGRPFSAFSDMANSPTHVSTLFDILGLIIRRRLSGVFHAAGCERLSREEFARRIAAAFQLDPGLIRGETRTENVRPPDLSLDSRATYAALSYQPRSLEQILSEHRADWGC